MATRPCDRKSVCQYYVDILISAKQYAMLHGYSEAKSKRIAMVVLNRLAQGGIWQLYLAIKPIENHTATGGQQSVKTFNRLIANRETKQLIDFKNCLKPWWV